MPSRSLIDRATTGTGAPRRPGVPACGGVSGVGGHGPCPTAPRGTQHEPVRVVLQSSSRQRFESSISNPSNRQNGVFDTLGSGPQRISRPNCPTPVLASCSSWHLWRASHGFKSGVRWTPSCSSWRFWRLALRFKSTISGSLSCSSWQLLHPVCSSSCSSWRLWTNASGAQKMRFVRENRPIGPTRCGSVQNSSK